jgi:hypothetical protein
MSNLLSSHRALIVCPQMDRLLRRAFLIFSALGLVSLLWIPSRTKLVQAACPTARNLDPSALRGDAAEANWLVYRNAKTGLSFRYPPSVRVEERDPTKFGFDSVPDAIVDLRGDWLNNTDFIVMRFICAAGIAAEKARALRAENQPIPSPIELAGHRVIVSCSCTPGGCSWGVVTLPPRECSIFPMEPGEFFNDRLPPLHDGHFPLLSIINTVHFSEPATK